MLSKRVAPGVGECAARAARSAGGDAADDEAHRRPWRHVHAQHLRRRRVRAITLQAITIWAITV